jgi:hypothetical protein
MKFASTRICLVLTLYWLSATASAQQPPSNSLGCIDIATTDSSIDYFPSKVTPTLSKQWSIIYNNTYKILTNENTRLSYLLYQCGTDILDNIDVSAFDGIYEIPVTTGFAVTQTTSLAYLNDLGVIPDGLKAYGNDPLYISNACVLQSIQSNEISVFIDNSTIMDETIASMLTFGFPFDESSPFTTNVVEVSEFSEFSNGATYEWIKFYSTFFNLEELANNLFDAAQHKYNCTRNQTTSAEITSVRPTALWAYYNSNCGGWDVLQSCDTSDLYQYPCQFAKDGGFDLIGTTTEGTVTNCAGKSYLTTDEFITVGAGASVWFFPAPDWGIIYSTYKEQLDTMVSVKSSAVYDTQARGDNDWFEQRLVRYYDVLYDFCSVTGSLQRDGNAHINWFRNVFEDQIEKNTNCTNSSILPYDFQCAAAELSSSSPALTAISQPSPTERESPIFGSDAPSPMVSDLTSFVVSDMQSNEPTALQLTLTPSITSQPTEAFAFGAGNSLGRETNGSSTSEPEIAGLLSSTANPSLLCNKFVIFFVIVGVLIL